jgi:hypothetical protein
MPVVEAILFNIAHFRPAGIPTAAQLFDGLPAPSAPLFRARLGRHGAYANNANVVHDAGRSRRAMEAVI